MSASRFKVQKEKKVTCSHDIKYYVKRVGVGKGRAVGNDVYVYSHLGSAGEDL